MSRVSGGAAAARKPACVFFGPRVNHCQRFETALKYWAVLQVVVALFYKLTCTTHWVLCVGVCFFFCFFLLVLCSDQNCKSQYCSLGLCYSSVIVQSVCSAVCTLLQALSSFLSLSLVLTSLFQINELSNVPVPVMLMPDDFKAYSKIKVDNHLFNK